MPIPLGDNAPCGPVRTLESHTVTEARERDLATLKNGEPNIAGAVNAAGAGSCAEADIPFD